MLVMFKIVGSDGKTHTVMGKLNKKTMEITLPSGYKLPVESNGYVLYLGQTSQVTDVNGNPIV